jgi:acetylornithine/N-succinyldiaminopimelate aminotransferase
VTFDELRAAEASFHMPVYGRQPVAFVRGAGTTLWDSEGNGYLDFVAGIAVMSVGHSHPKVVEAIREQVGRLTHVSNLYYTEPQVRLAGRLHDLLGWGKVFFANSGAEANEAAIKLVRKRGLPLGKPRIVALEGSFHGRTVATLAATGQAPKRAAFEPLVDWFVFVPPNDEAALREALASGDVGAVLLEPVMGEGGVRPLEHAYLRAARRLCDEHDALLVADEVQSGSGRCGRWLAIEAAGVVPDVATLAKALGGGLPIGACIARGELAFAPGDHASTFGGGPVPCAAALAVIDTIERDGLRANALAMGELLRSELGRAAPDHVAGVRGAGLLIGIQLVEQSAHDVVLRMLRGGVLATEAGPDVVRMSPPFTVSADDVAEGVKAFADAVPEVA